MNDTIIKEISKDLGISEKQVTTVLELLSDGNTIPFIARYRKEATGALDEEVIRKINEVYEYQLNLLKRKEDVIRLIDEKGLLTEELKNTILACSKLVEVEDLYRPYKEKKKTKATDAIKNGLEPLAKKIMSFPINGSIEELAKPYINENVSDTEKAVEGASYIIAEWISDNASYRKYIRNYLFKNATIISKIKKKAEDSNKVYEMYYDYSEVVKYAKPHRIMAMNRGEKEGVLSVSLDYDKDNIISFLEKKLIKNNKSFVVDIVKNAIVDSLKRLILPSVEREIRAELKENAEITSINNFSTNVENLLLTPPMKEKVVLGYDPAFRTGCKLAVLDKTGKPLEIAVIYPTEPHLKIEESKKKVLELIDKYNIDIIAIGNGTASRESEAFIADVIKEAKRHVDYIIVNEAGASVYSASKLAIEEFPDLTVEKRSAISIGRRLQDALSELVKIDPKAIGVGQYQHDVNQKKLGESLTGVVEDAVNSVGVDVNTATPSLLSYVAGVSQTVAKNIVKYREENGKFKERKELLKVPKIGKASYEQCAGFIRIPDGKNPLEITGVHPESYKIAENMLDKLGFKVKDLADKDKFKQIKEKLSTINNEKEIKIMAKELEVGEPTLKDIVIELMKPGRDPREEMPKPILRSDVLKFEDLSIGMILTGTIRNVTDFGAFVDIGVKHDGLVHISEMSDKFVKNPSEIVSVGDVVKVKVIDIDKERQKVKLSMKV